MAGWTHAGTQVIRLPHSDTFGQFKVATPPAARVWLWEDAGEPGENPHEHGENMQSPRRKAPAPRGISTPNIPSVIPQSS